MTKQAPPPEALQWLGKFLGQLAHDLSSPTRNSSGFCELVLRKVQTLEDETLLKHADLACAETKRLQRMLHAAMELGQIYTQPINPKPFDLNSAAQAVWDESIKAHYPNAVLQVKASEPQPLDSKLAQTLLRVLLENGCQYNTATPEITLSLAKEADYVVLTVEDNGIGLAEADFEKACTLYKRLHASDYPEGIGAGLAYAHAIAQRHNGTMRCESTKHGTKITVKLAV